MARNMTTSSAVASALIHSPRVCAKVAKSLMLHLASACAHELFRCLKVDVKVKSGSSTCVNAAAPKVKRKENAPRDKFSTKKCAAAVASQKLEHAKEN